MGAADLLLHIRSAGFALDVADDKLLVTPASMLTDELRAALRACKPELIQLLTQPALTDDDAVAVDRTCAGCAHRLPRGTCADPVAAGLRTAAEGFAIAWADEGHATTCPAFEVLRYAAGLDRPYRLAQADGDAAHAEPWDDGAIVRFGARKASIQRSGFEAQDAEDLAVRLHLRDVQADHRHLCLECIHYRPGRCGNHRAAALATAEVGRDLATMFQHCAGFAETKGNP